jgi:hypothetical protein
VYSNLVKDPIDCHSEVYEPEEGFGQLFIAGADPAVAFDAAEEVFDRMTVSIKCPTEAVGDTTGTSRWNAHERARAGEILAEHIGVESSIPDDPEAVESWQERCAGVQIMLGSGRKVETDCASHTVDHCGELRVEPAFGPPDRLRGLSSGRIRTVLVDLDV